MELGPMEFGIFHEFPRREGTSDESGFDHGFELVDAAEQWGLDASGSPSFTSRRARSWPPRSPAPPPSPPAPSA